jgi:hypothetical protein
MRLAIKEKAAQAKPVLRSDIVIGNDEVMEGFAGSAMIIIHVPSITSRWTKNDQGAILRREPPLGS